MKPVSDTQYITKQFTHNLRPAYYDTFQCLAADCRINCCDDPWDILFDRSDYLKVRQQKGSPALNDAIKQALFRVQDNTSVAYGGFRHDAETGCPLQTEEGLCRLQTECGYNALPTVCKVFPRVKHYSPSGYYEYTLSLGCEAVLEQLWHLPEGIDFLSDPLPQAERASKNIPTQNAVLSSYFQDIRALCIDILQDRRFPLKKRILLMGFFLQKLQADAADIPKWLTETEALLQYPELEALIDSLFDSITENSDQLILLQHCRSIIEFTESKSHTKLSAFELLLLKELLGNTLDIPDLTKPNVCEFSLDTPKFQQASKQFSKYFADKEYFFENLFVSLFFAQTLPSYSSISALWISYIHFCNTYSLLRFLAIGSCLGHAKTDAERKNALFTAIVYGSRNLLHNSKRSLETAKRFIDTQSDSLAHMALLLNV